MVDAEWLRPGLGFALGRAGEELGELQVEIGKLQSALSDLQMAMGDTQAAIGKTNRFGLHGKAPVTGRTNDAWLYHSIVTLIRARNNVLGELRRPAAIQREARDVGAAVDNLIHEMDRMRLVT